MRQKLLRSSLRPAENASFVFLALFRYIASARCRSVTGVLWVAVRLLVPRVCHVYLVDKLENFLVQLRRVGRGEW